MANSFKKMRVNLDFIKVMFIDIKLNEDTLNVVFFT